MLKVGHSPSFQAMEVVKFQISAMTAVLNLCVIWEPYIVYFHSGKFKECVWFPAPACTLMSKLGPIQKQLTSFAWKKMVSGLPFKII